MQILVWFFHTITLKQNSPSLKRYYTSGILPVGLLKQIFTIRVLALLHSDECINVLRAGLHHFFVCTNPWINFFFPDGIQALFRMRRAHKRQVPFRSVGKELALQMSKMLRVSTTIRQTAFVFHSGQGHLLQIGLCKVSKNQWRRER